jgi:uncharacterized membrane-anchored protein
MSDDRGKAGGRIRLIVIGGMTVFILAFVNLQIAAKERIVREGTTVLLRLAPVDPRSLMQGDYMALRYAMAGEVASASEDAGVSDGEIVIELDENGEARFIEIHKGQALSGNRHLLVFRKRGESVRLASDAWFFEEGTGEAYRRARFGELRVGEHGEAVLTGLRGDDYRRLDPEGGPVSDAERQGGL